MSKTTKQSRRGSHAGALLSLFKTQLENECKNLGERLGIDDRGKQLMWWYLMEIVGLSEVDTAEAVCDGGGDLGVDSIWIDDDKVVYFFQFKNPTDAVKTFPESDVDTVISGLKLILSRQHETIANELLKERIQDIYDIVPRAYRLLLVTSGSGIPTGTGSQLKLDAFIRELDPPSEDFIRWECVSLATIQDRHYSKNLPAIRDPIIFDSVQAPYMVQSGSSRCFFFHVPAEKLATLFEQYGDGLLQRNIRISQGPTPTNRAIAAACRGNDSVNFLHYNNGVTFICDTAQYDPFQHTINLSRSQVVNGGQTVRALHGAFADGSLKTDVLVPLRVITSNGDKDFGSNVAVNQNNQNQMRTGFLRSNDPRVVQLASALAAIGWYLERREGEADTVEEAERNAIESRIGRAIEGHTIKLKEGSQAYVATFFKHPELAKKDPKKIFLSSEDGGYFERVFSHEMTGEKFVIAHQVKEFVDGFVHRFSGVKRKRSKEADGWEVDYRTFLGDAIMDQHLALVDQVVPTSAFFLCATVFREHTEIAKEDPATLPKQLRSHGDRTLQRHLFRIFEYAQQNPVEINRSWPTLLKSNRFFNGFHSYLAGIHVGKNGG